MTETADRTFAEIAGGSAQALGTPDRVVQLQEEGGGPLGFLTQTEGDGRYARFNPAVAPLDAGSVLFADASGRISEDNANFFWDDTNNRLHVGPRGMGTAAGIFNVYHVANTPGLVLTASGQLQLPVQGSTGGLLIGGDVNLYRHAANLLASQDGMIFANNLGLSLKLTAQGVDGFSAISFEPVQSRITFGPGNAASDTNLYRSAADVLKTDDAFDANELRVQGTKVVGARGAAVADAAGGITIDVEARAAINSLLARLRAATGHGLIA